MNKVFILMLVLFSSLAFAQEIYCKPNQEIQLTASFIDENSLVQDINTTNITVQYPNGNLLVDNQLMNYSSGSIYYYNLTCPNYLGTYKTTYTGIVNNKFGQEQSYFVVNTRGNNDVIDFFLIGMVLSQLIIIAYFMFMRFLVENEYVQFACTFFASLEFVILLFMVYGIVFGGVIDIVLKINFYLIGIIMIGVLFWKLVELAIHLLDMRKQAKAEKDGWEKEEKW